LAVDRHLRLRKRQLHSDFTAFTSFTPLSERFSNSALAVHASGDVIDIWHARLTLSRIVDDLRQEQVDAYTCCRWGTSTTRRETPSICRTM